jgi:hypothetical protein
VAATHNTLTTPAHHGSATSVVDVGGWLVPIACVLMFSLALAFDAFLSETRIVTSAEPQDSSNKSFTRVASAANGENP